MALFSVEFISFRDGTMAVWLSSDQLSDEILALMLAEQGVEADANYRGSTGQFFARAMVSDEKGSELSAALVARGGSVL